MQINFCYLTGIRISIHYKWPFFSSPVRDYYVEVYTGDKFGAGTDANVYLEICGDRGDTGERHLHGTRTDGKMFEREMVRLLALDVFLIFLFP